MKSTQDNLTDGLTIDVSGSSPEQDDQCIVKGGVNLDHFGGAKVDQLVKG